MSNFRIILYYFTDVKLDFSKIVRFIFYIQILRHTHRLIRVDIRQLSNIFALLPETIFYGN